MTRDEFDTIPAISDAIADQIESLEGSLKGLRQVADAARKGLSSAQARALFNKVDDIIARHSLFCVTSVGRTVCAAQGIGATMDMLLELLCEHIGPDH
ncbi:hypothetical protein RNI52_34485 [Labrys neptuniae]|uniref:hypothetical protein n=1 Tax=Labrys neptuniae TaxID=376174 RepID=UPI00288FF7FC|nr:hypothetical protein [Labrys neptuniae]MDT3382485.1 hypothetical protein [Labrys neptuniae]